jgi:hypothetical protein
VAAGRSKRLGPFVTSNASFISIERNKEMASTPTLRRCACFCTLAGGLLWTSPALGQALTPPSAALQGPTLIVGELKQIRKVLEMADHDYKGHRAAAVHEITKAIHAFEPPGTMKKGAGKKLGGGAGLKKGGNNEPQSVSDAQLAQSVKNLQTVVTQIGTNPTGNAAVAQAALTKAIEELETALKIK